MLKNLAENYISQKRHRGKSRVVRLLMRTIPFKSLRSHYGPVLCCNPADRTNVYAISGDYGHVISNHIKSLPVDSTFIDIGANYGLFALLAAGHVKHVYAYEPNPVIFKFLSEAIKLNNIENLTALNCAVGPEDGEMKLRYDKNHSGLSSLVTDAQNDNGEIFIVKVENIAKNKSLASPSIHLKIDVEGFESSIIATLQKAPWYQNIRSMVIEIDDKNLRKFGSSAAALYETLEKDGFKPAIGPKPGIHYDEIFTRPSA